jgi:aspartate aminotransferase-like enzyme
MSFRIGLFGLDKLMNIDRTVSLFEQALGKVESA